MKRKMQQNEKEWKLRLTEALQAEFWTLEVARDEKEVFPTSGKKESMKEQERKSRKSRSNSGSIFMPKKTSNVQTKAKCKRILDF